MTGWVRISAAAAEAQRQLGGPLADANDAVWDACDANEIVSRRDDDGDYWVLDTSLLVWLKAQQRPRKRTSRKLALAQEAIKAIWPDGIPNTVTNPQIEREVGSWLDAYFARQQLRKFDISRPTILRAAGRRNN
jgi:hypothetical protein